MTFELLDADKKIDHIRSTLEERLGITGISAQTSPVPTGIVPTVDGFKTALDYFSVQELRRTSALALYFTVTIPGYRGHPGPIQLRVQLSSSQEEQFKSKYGDEYRLRGW